MRYVGFLLALVILFSVAHAASVDSRIIKALDGQEEVPVIVMLKKHTQTRIASAGIYDSDEFKKERDFGALGGFSGKVSRKGLQGMLKNPRIASIQLDKPVHALMSQSAPLVNASQAWTLNISGANITGRGETVCVIDTGIDYNHTALGGGWGSRVLGGYNYCANEACTQESSDPYDNHGHGTHVAGSIASNDSTQRGVAFEANLVAIKALNSAGSGTDSDVIAGMNWCIANATAYNISVISMSLGGSLYNNTYCDSSETAYRDAINTAVANNISVVVASGNDASNTSMSVPACIQNATSVGAVYDADIGSTTFSVCTDSTTAADKVTCYTDRNSLLDLLAPGSRITSTLSGVEGGGFGNKHGTSMAAPHVSAAFVLLRQYKRLENGTILTPAQIENTLKGTGVNVSDTRTGLNFSRISIISAIRFLDAAKPLLSVSSPENRTYNTTNISLAYSASDAVALDLCSFTNTTGGPLALSGCSSTTFLAAAGQQNITVSVNDSNGNANSSQIFFTVDTAVPLLSVASPQNITYAASNISISYSASDSNRVDRCWLVNTTGSTVFLNSQGGTCSNTTIRVTGNAQYNVTVFVNDTGGNVNSSRVFFSLSIFSLTIQQPANITYNRNASLELNFTLDSNNTIDKIWYSIDNGANATVTSNALFNTSEGFHVLVLSANDTSSAVNSTNVSFTSDMTPPNATFTSPENRTYNTTSISINYTARDNFRVDRCTLEWLNQSAVNTTLANCTNTTLLAAAGSSYVKLWMNDSAGNVNVSVVNFAVDIAAPPLSVQSPTNITYASGNISVNYTVGGFETCWLVNATGHTMQLSGCTNTTILAPANQQSNITIFANDSGGNLNSTQVFFTVDTISPFASFTPPTPGNETLSTANDVTINVTLSELPSSVLLEWNGANITMNGSGTLWFYSHADLQDGNYSFRVVANDTAGNVNVTAFRWVFVNATRNFTSFINSLNASLSQTNVSFVLLNTTGASESVVFADVNYTLRFNITGIIADVANFSWLSANTSNLINVTRNITIANLTITFNVSGGVLDNYVWVDLNNFTTGNYTPRVTFFGAFRLNYYINGTRDNPDPVRINETCLQETNKPCYSIRNNLTVINLASFSGAATGNDTQPPSISVSSPSGIYTTSNASLSYSVADNVAVGSCWFSLNSGANVTPANCTNTTINAASGTNTIVLYANDTSGNANSSSVSFTYNPPPAPITSGSGGGGSIALPTSYKRQTWTIITSSAVMNVATDALPLKSIVVRVNQPAKDVSIVVSPERTAPAPLENAYQYFTINATNLPEHAISYAEIVFAVNRSWMENNYSKDTVRMNRFSNGWLQLPTNLTDENATHLTYISKTNGFSYFAITAEPKKAAPRWINETSLTGASSNTTPEKEGRVCIQVIAPAEKNGTCILYPTPCDVPAGWTPVRECPSESGGLEKNLAVVMLMIILAVVMLLFAIFVLYKLTKRKTRRRPSHHRA